MLGGDIADACAGGEVAVVTEAVLAAAARELCPGAGIGITGAFCPDNSALPLKEELRGVPRERVEPDDPPSLLPLLLMRLNRLGRRLTNSIARETFGGDVAELVATIGRLPIPGPAADLVDADKGSAGMAWDPVELAGE